MVFYRMNAEGVQALKINGNTALLVIDVQMGFNEPKWGDRNNPEAETNIAALLAAWRREGLPIVHVHHDSVTPTGVFKPGTPGHEVKPEAEPLPGEPLFHKSVNSAFIGTELKSFLRHEGISDLVVTGLTTNHCVSTTTRMAGNLGFETFIVSDATATFARDHVDGSPRSAEEVHRAALSDLNGEFAAVVTTADVLVALRSSGSSLAAGHGQRAATI